MTETAEAIKGDVLTDARVKRKDVRIEEGERGGIGYYTDQMPFDVYFSKNFITKTEYIACDKIHRTYELSRQSSVACGNLDRIGSSNQDFTEKQLEARAQWREAILSIPGDIGKRMVIDVCCYGYMLRERRYAGYKTSSHAMSRFREAISCLAQYYNLTRNSK